jgi:hypothetical protein
VRSVPANQPNLSEDCGELCAWRKGPPPRDEEIVLGTEGQVDGGHGRVEPRPVWCPTALEGGVSSERWPG